jgi:predicted MFS family arabinose efflux permease
MWSVIAPIGARMVPATHAARATMAVYVGTGLALVIGSPLTAALSALWGWRLAVAAITVAAAVVLVAARFTLPLMAMPEAATLQGGRRPGDKRNRQLLTMCALTLIGVTGHFVSYTFIVVIIRDIVGVTGPNLAWLLAAYGVAGLTAMGLLARPGDRHPKAAIVGCLAGLTAVFSLLAALGWSGERTGGVVLAGVVAVVAWGATATAMPPMLQSAAMRHSPDDPDGASGLYVAAFQVGIMAGSLIGGVLIERAGLSLMLAVSALLVAAVLAGVLAGRDLFAATPATSGE